MRILFFGTRKHGLAVLNRLIGDGHDILAVTTEDYGMDHVTSDDFRAVAEAHGIAFHKTDDIENDAMAAVFAGYGAQLGVCAGWRRLIRDKVMAAAPLGFIGPHGADLPRYRGFAATHWAILNGDDHCGFCIMRFKPGEADNGDICRRYSVPITDDTTIADLFEQSEPLLLDNISAVVREMEAGTLVCEPQDEARAVYAYPRLPRDGEIDWARPAEEVHRLVRTVTRPYPGAYTFLELRKLFVWKTALVHEPHQWVGQPGHIVHFRGKVCVLTGDGLLELVECQFEGGAAFAPRDEFTTHRLRLGMDTSGAIHELSRRLADAERRLARLEDEGGEAN